VTVSRIDHAQLVQADDQEGAGLLVPQRLRQRLVERLAQTNLVEVAGELVKIRSILELGFMLFALGDQAKHTDQPLGRACVRDLDRAAIVNPLRFAVAGAEPVLAIEGSVTGEMFRERAHARGHVFRIDSVIQVFTLGRQCGRVLAENRGRRAQQRQLVRRQIPLVEDVARGLDCSANSDELRGSFFLVGRWQHRVALLADPVFYVKTAMSCGRQTICSVTWAQVKISDLRKSKTTRKYHGCAN
jgi:hypothetical protein